MTRKQANSYNALQVMEHLLYRMDVTRANILMLPDGQLLDDEREILQSLNDIYSFMAHRVI